MPNGVLHLPGGAPVQGFQTLPLQGQQFIPHLAHFLQAIVHLQSMLFSAVGVAALAVQLCFNTCPCCCPSGGHCHRQSPHLVMHVQASDCLLMAGAAALPRSSRTKLRTKREPSQLTAMRCSSPQGMQKQKD